MKPITKSIRNYIETVTPFRFINTPDQIIRIYWTKKGTEGYQCIVVCYDNKTSEMKYYKTGGYGYAKDEACLSHVFNFIGKAPREMLEALRTSSDCESGFSCYHVGGNFYKIPKRDWLNI